MDIETAKRNAARQAVHDHFPRESARYIGIGSGTTVVHVVNAIKELNLPFINQLKFVATGTQSRKVILDAGLSEIRFDELRDEPIDVAFDGADEVDEDLNCIKGGGACLYQEKLVATQAKKFICVADHRKLQSRLLDKWPAIPIEVEVLAVQRVLLVLQSLGSSKPTIRYTAGSDTEYLRTDQNNFIVDAPFPPLLLPSDQNKHASESDSASRRWEVTALEKVIKSIEGVLSVGLFCGRNGQEASAAGESNSSLGWGGQKPFAAYFGMQDGSVTIRNGNHRQSY